MIRIAFKIALICLLLAAGYLVATAKGDWAARLGSLMVALSLISVYFRTKSDVWDPADGPIIFDDGGAEDYSPSKEDLSDYRRSVGGLFWEFFGATVGTLVNGFAPWAAAWLVARGF